MTFSKALKLLKKNNKLTRKIAWSNMYIKLIYIPDFLSKEIEENLFNDFTIVQVCKNGVMCGWVPTIKDLLANDWEVF